MTGVFDYEGKKCYSVFLGRKEVCEHCNKDQIEWQEFYYRQLYNDYLKEDIFKRRYVYTRKIDELVWKKMPSGFCKDFGSGRPVVESAKE